MKQQYEKPEIKLIRFETEDVLKASGIELPDHEWSLRTVKVFDEKWLQI